MATERRRSKYLDTFLYLSDLGALNIAFIIAHFLRYSHWDFLKENHNQTLILIANISWVLLLYHFRGLKNFRVENIESILKRTSSILYLFFAVLAIFIFLLNFDRFSRLTLLYFFISFFIFILTIRILVFKVLKKFRSSGSNYRKFIIVGNGERADLLSDYISADITYGLQCAGVFNSEGTNIKNQNYRGNLDNIEDYLKSEPIDEMYVVVDDETQDQIDSLISLCDQHFIRIKFIPDFYKYTKSKNINIDYYGNLPIMMFRKEPLTSLLNRALKRSFDILFSLCAIILVFSWLFPIVWLIIKLESKGPAIFKQERSGENNEHFICYKFRSMKHSPDSEFVQATQNDMRVTKFGAFIRKTSIDELPQFFNVLFGSMSVVGPRPHPIGLDHQYETIVKEYRVRHYAKPGITGWAQVKGHRGETRNEKEMRNRIKHDVWYIENWSFFLDLKIVFLTIWNVIKGDEQAY